MPQQKSHIPEIVRTASTIERQLLNFSHNSADELWMQNEKSSSTRANQGVAYLFVCGWIFGVSTMIYSYPLIFKSTKSGHSTTLQQSQVGFSAVPGWSA
jgi:hypothetical protein